MSIAEWIMNLSILLVCLVDLYLMDKRYDDGMED